MQVRSQITKKEMLSYYKEHFRDRSGYEIILAEAETRYPNDCLRSQILGAAKDIFLLFFPGAVRLIGASPNGCRSSRQLPHHGADQQTGGLGTHLLDIETLAGGHLAFEKEHRHKAARQDVSHPLRPPLCVAGCHIRAGPHHHGAGRP